MQDTAPEARQKQFEIIFSKTEQQRLSMGVEMIEDMRKIVMKSIYLKNPGISAIDSKIEFINRYYRHDFTPGEFSAMSSMVQG
jgi:hypothetical protein